MYNEAKFDCDEREKLIINEDENDIEKNEKKFDVMNVKNDENELKV